jgi:hypothetical protein
LGEKAIFQGTLYSNRANSTKKRRRDSPGRENLRFVRRFRRADFVSCIQKKWSIKDTLTEIHSNSGKHFDPELVEMFKAISHEILAIKEEYAEPNGGEILNQV